MSYQIVIPKPAQKQLVLLVDVILGHRIRLKIYECTEIKI